MAEPTPTVNTTRRQSVTFPDEQSYIRRLSLKRASVTGDALVAGIVPGGLSAPRPRTRRRSTAHDDFLQYFTYESKAEQIIEESEEEVSSVSDAIDSGPAVEDREIQKKKQKKTNYGYAKNGMKFRSDLHAVIHKYTESKFFNGFIMFLIFINTSMLVAQTWQVVNVRASWYFAALDNIFLGVYVMEVVLKLYVWRLSFFKEGWNILDFTIVVFNIVDFALPLIIQNVGGFNGAAIFRLLRIFRAVKAIRALRVLRTIRFLANLQVIMTTLLQSIRSIGAIVMLITLTMYMFAVIGKGLYSEVDEVHFGSLFQAGFTLFQLLTLDDWFEIYKIISEKGRGHIIFYLILYIVVEYLIFLNLFVAVLVDNFQLSLEAANEAAKEKKLAQENEEEEEDLYGMEGMKAPSVSTMPSDEVKEKKTVKDYYSSRSQEELDSLAHYFRLLTSLEHNYMILNKQQRIMNMMVDICADSNDDV